MRGAPAKYAHHKRNESTDIVNGKIVGSKSKRVSCSMCEHYCEDKSCTVRPLYIPDVGYDTWKFCKEFSLDNKFATEYIKEMVRKYYRY